MYLWQAFHFHVIYASSIYTTYNREIMKPYVYYITIHSLSNENLIEHFLIHRLHTKTSTITKPKPERKNSKEPTRAPRASNSGIPRSQTQTLTRMDKVVIGDYYLMATMDGIINWMKLAHLLSIFSLNLTTLFCTTAFTSKIQSTFLNVNTREEAISLLTILCTLIFQIIPLSTLTIICAWYEKPISHDQTQAHNGPNNPKKSKTSKNHQVSQHNGTWELLHLKSGPSTFKWNPNQSNYMAALGWQLFVALVGVTIFRTW